MKRGPEQAELEREHRARDGADGEQDRGALGPALGQVEVEPVAGLPVAPLGDDHQHGHADADDGEDDVEAERDRHLRAGGEEIGHAGPGVRDGLVK